MCAHEGGVGALLETTKAVTKHSGRLSRHGATAVALLLFLGWEVAGEWLKRLARSGGVVVVSSVFL